MEMESAELHDTIYSDLQFWTTRYNTIIIHLVESMLYLNQYTPLFLLIERTDLVIVYAYATISLTGLRHILSVKNIFKLPKSSCTRFLLLQQRNLHWTGFLWR